MFELIKQVAQGWWQWVWPMTWQVGILIGIIYVIDLVSRRWVWPQVRYVLWLLVLVKLVLPPTWSSSVSFVGEVNHWANYNEVEVVSAVMECATVPHEEKVFSESVSSSIPVSTIPSSLPVQESWTTSVTIGTSTHKTMVSLWKICILAVWLVGVVVMVGWLLVRLESLKRSRQQSAQEGPGWFAEVLQLAANRVGVKRMPQVIWTAQVKSPAVFGLVRPVLLMPADKAETLQRTEAEHILLHELCHIKRGDLWIHAVYVVVQIVYWFNPLLWLVRRQLQHLRELCCDASVARLLKEQTPAYRGTLLEIARQLLAERTEVGLGLLGLFETSNRLGDRLGWLQKKTWRFHRLRWTLMALLVAVMLFCVLPMAKSETPPSLRLHGVVTDVQTGKPIPGASVRDDHYGPKLGAITDPNGSYSYLTWPEEHGVRVEAEGYQTSWQGIDGGMLQMAKEKTLNFVLQPHEKSINAPAGEMISGNNKAELADGATVELNEKGNISIRPKAIWVNPPSGTLMPLVSELMIVFDQPMMPDCFEVTESSLPEKDQPGSNVTLIKSCAVYQANTRSFTIPLTLPGNWNGSVELSGFKNVDGIEMAPMVLDYSTLREPFSQSLCDRFAQARQSNDLRTLLDNIKNARSKITSLVETVECIFNYSNKKESRKKTVFKMQGEKQFFADMSDNFFGQPWMLGSDGQTCWIYHQEDKTDLSKGYSLVVTDFNEIHHKNVSICDPFGLRNLDIDKVIEDNHLEYLGMTVLNAKKCHLVRSWHANVDVNRASSGVTTWWFDSDTFLPVQIEINEGGYHRLLLFTYEHINAPLAHSEFWPEFLTGLEPDTSSELAALGDGYDAWKIEIADGAATRYTTVSWHKEGSKGTCGSGFN